MEEKTEAGLSNKVPVIKKSGNFLVVGIFLILVVIVVPKLFSSPENAEAPMTAITTPTETIPTAEITPVDVVNGAISVEAGSFYYKPNLIRVKKGEKIKLTLNSVSMMHDFNIDELGVKVPVTKSGSSSTVEFTASKVGEFQFYCSVGNHRAMGQVGTLIVTE